MSPELAEGRGDVDGRGDLYSLGVVGYQLLTGQLPFEGTAEQLMVGHRTRFTRNPTVRHPDVPVDLAEVVMRCLAKLPQNRWADASDLLAALHRLGGEPGRAAHAVPPARPVRTFPAVRAAPPPASRAIPASALASPPVPTTVATPPSRVAVGTPTVSLPKTGATFPTVRVTRSPAPVQQRPLLRNAPLWAAAAIVVLLIGYCALQQP